MGAVIYFACSVIPNLRRNERNLGIGAADDHQIPRRSSPRNDMAMQPGSRRNQPAVI